MRLRSAFFGVVFVCILVQTGISEENMTARKCYELRLNFTSIPEYFVSIEHEKLFGKEYIVGTDFQGRVHRYESSQIQSIQQVVMTKELLDRIETAEQQKSDVSLVNEGKENTSSGSSYPSNRSVASRYRYSSGRTTRYKQDPSQQKRRKLERKMDELTRQCRGILNVLKNRNGNDNRTEILKCQYMEIMRRREQIQKEIQQISSQGRKTKKGGSWWEDEIRKKRERAAALRIEADDLELNAGLMDINNAKVVSGYRRSQSLKTRAFLKREKARKLREQADKLLEEAEQLEKMYEQKKKFPVM